jgi:hypothetical protein
MSALSIQPTYPIFQGRDGQPLENGYVWIGEPNLNPQTNPVVVYFDAALTIPAPQPLRTLNGYISRAGTPAQIYVNAVNFSILVQDGNGSMVYNFPEGAGAAPFALKGANSDITSLSGLTTALSVLQGGTGATTAGAAPFALKGANSDITSLSGLTTALSVLQGGTGTTGGVPDKIQTIGGSVAASALTVTAGALALDFRSATLTSGTITTVSGTPASLVVPSGATLGTVNAVQSRIVVLALNNAGTIELAVVNISGGNDLTETGVISTTAISAAADVANVIYSTTARTSVAYRVVGYVESTQATAGTWTTTPSTIQGQGGQALAAMSSLGYGQTWQNVTGSRTVGTTYYNTTGKPIQLQLSGNNATVSTLTITVNGVAAVSAGLGATFLASYSVAIPPTATYVVAVTAGSLANVTWTELR